MTAKRIIIAIDGYSSCGKSTIAKGIAARLGYLYIDSGAMYRAVTLYCLENKIISDGKFQKRDVIAAMKHIELNFLLNPDTKQSEIVMNGRNAENEIRQMDVSNHVSPVSAIKEVRQQIVALQRKLAAEMRLLRPRLNDEVGQASSLPVRQAGSQGIVMDGRDIGTNVFPDAEIKIFMTADENIRAQRRWKELKEKGMNVTFEEVKKNLSQRDYEDTHRKHNPLRKAKDAIALDSTNMTVDEQLNYVLKLIKEKANLRSDKSDSEQRTK